MSEYKLLSFDSFKTDEDFTICDFENKLKEELPQILEENYGIAIFDKEIEVLKFDYIFKNDEDVKLCELVSELISENDTIIIQFGDKCNVWRYFVSKNSILKDFL